MWLWLKDITNFIKVNGEWEIWHLCTCGALMVKNEKAVTECGPTDDEKNLESSVPLQRGQQ
jgi:hypothetical protein